MKNLAFACALALISSASAADPNPYADYGKAMASDANHPMAVEWQNADGAALADATDESVLASFVSDAESAKALLDRLRPAYETCPIVLTQIAAVTQWVMTPEPTGWFAFLKPSPAAGRKVWIAALEAKAKSASDEYVRTFCRQQLDLCR